MVGFFKYPKRKLKRLIKDGEYDEAILLGTRLEYDFANDHDFMFIMGSIYLIVEDAQKALSYFEKAIALDDNDVETFVLKTNAHLTLEQKDGAITCCRRILELRPEDSEALQLLRQLEDL